MTGSFESATGTERGPYSGLAASKSACPLSVIGAGGSSVVAGPSQTPLKSGCDWEVVGDWHPNSAAGRANTASRNIEERIKTLQSR
jgi:hypothetical protein